MDTHSMIFVTIGNLVSPSSSVNGDPLFDFPDHLGSLVSSSSSLFAGEVRGADLARPPPNEKTYRLQTATAAAILWKVELVTS
jgi:hypothetical protein